MNYNPHDIAYEIERIAEKAFGVSFAHSKTIFDRDFIEKESMYECMALILHLKGNEKSFDFLNGIHNYKRKNMNTIPNLCKVLDEFKNCLTQK